MRVTAITSRSAQIQWEQPRDSHDVVVRGYMVVGEKQVHCKKCLVQVKIDANIGIPIDGEHENVYTINGLSKT